MSKVSPKRHLAKALTWRVVGTIDTILLGWIFTGNPLTGLKIGFAEIVTKTAIYYLHERFWSRIDYSKYKFLSGSRRRHLMKTVTWRFIATLDTTILAWIISGNPITGLQVGGAEVVTKMGLYYLHERAWHRSKFGIKQGNTLTTEADAA